MIKVFLTHAQAYELLLGDWMAQTARWAQVVGSRSQEQGGGRKGLLDMAREAANQTMDGIATGNIACAALVLRHLFKVRVASRIPELKH